MSICNCNNPTIRCILCITSDKFAMNNIDLKTLSERKNELCICDDDTQRCIGGCVMCHIEKEKLMNKMDRRDKCEVHHNIVIMVCSQPIEFVCNDCEELGWLSIPFHNTVKHINVKTQRSKDIDKSIHDFNYCVIQ